jgi:hypothetical protein
LWTNAGEIPGNSVDDDGNGFVDDHLGWDWVNNDNDPTDDSGHGSNIAGTVGAITDNGVGYAGLDRSARLMILKIFAADLSGFYSWWIEAMTYAADRGARVINLSGGGDQPAAALEAAVDYVTGLGALFTAPMMNFNNNVPYYPAAYANAFAVGATNMRDERAAPYCWGGGSNFGPHIDLSAPGDYIYNITHSSDTHYTVFWCGSSMSAPTAGAAASMALALDPTLTVAELRELLQSTAADQVGRPAEDTPGWDIYHGHGRLDMFAAVSAVSTAAEDGPDGAVGITLASARPNPTSGRTVAVLTLDEPQEVRLELFDALGRRVATLHEGLLGAGSRSIEFGTQDLASGLYRLVLTGDAGSIARSLTVTGR